MSTNVAVEPVRLIIANCSRGRKGQTPIQALNVRGRAGTDREASAARPRAVRLPVRPVRRRRSRRGRLRPATVPDRRGRACSSRCRCGRPGLSAAAVLRRNATRSSTSGYVSTTSTASSDRDGRFGLLSEPRRVSTFSSPSRVTRRRTASSICRCTSCEITRPFGPTRRASRIVNQPAPAPMSATDAPSAMPRASMI